MNQSIDAISKGEILSFDKINKMVILKYKN